MKIIPQYAIYIISGGITPVFYGIALFNNNIFAAMWFIILAFFPSLMHAILLYIIQNFVRDILKVNSILIKFIISMLILFIGYPIFIWLLSSSLGSYRDAEFSFSLSWAEMKYFASYSLIFLTLLLAMDFTFKRKLLN